MKAQNDDQRGAPIARPSEVFVRELSPEEQQVLQELYHRTPDATIKTRCQIILLSAKPMSVPQIAQVTFYSEDTIARCIHAFHQSRLESLLPSPKGGRPPKITPDYLNRLFSIIEQDPRTLGCAPSSRRALSPSSPLRTVQVSFPTYGSSLSNAPRGTRFRYG